MTDANRRLLSDSEAGDILGMIPRRVARLAREGKIPSVVLPDEEVRFDEADLWLWVEEHKRPVVAGGGQGE